MEKDREKALLTKIREEYKINQKENDILDIFITGKFGFIPVNKQLINYFDEKTAMIYADIISKYLYWQEKGRLDSEGYFYYTSDSMNLHTGYSKNSQSESLYLLECEGLISAKTKKIEGQDGTNLRHVKVLLDSKALIRVFNLKNIAEVESIEDILDIIFKGSIMLNRSLLYTLGGAYTNPRNSLIYMELLQRYRTLDNENKLTDDSYLYISVEDLENSTGYKKDTQSRALKYLEDKGLIEIDYRGRSSRWKKKRFENKRFIKICLDTTIIENLLDTGIKLIEKREVKLEVKMKKDIIRLAFEIQSQE